MINIILSVHFHIWKSSNIFQTVFEKVRWSSQNFFRDEAEKYWDYILEDPVRWSPVSSLFINWSNLVFIQSMKIMETKLIVFLLVGGFIFLIISILQCLLRFRCHFLFPVSPPSLAEVNDPHLKGLFIISN